MKKTFFAIFVSACFSSCDPNNKDIFNMDSLKINGTIEKNSTVVKLGDTVTLSVMLPDTLAASSGTFLVQSLQGAQFYMGIEKVDTVRKISLAVSKNFYWTSKGSISTSNQMNFQFNTDTKPYGAIIHFKPDEKGLYMFTVASQAGQTKINNSLQPRLYVNFAVPDKHISLGEKYFGATWAADALTREFGTYLFRVE